MGKVTIWDSENVFSRSEGIDILWNCYSHPTVRDAVSIPMLVESSAESLRERYLSWIYDLGETKVNNRTVIEVLSLRKGFSFWWMTLLAEKSNFSKSPQITDALKLLAFDSWARDHDVDEIHLVSNNTDLVHCFVLWCSKRKVKFVHLPGLGSDKKISFLRQTYEILPNSLQALIWLFCYIAERWRLRGIGKDEWQQSKARITFVSYFVNLVPEALAQKRFKSRYWNDLSEHLEAAEVKTNWLHIYVKDGLIKNTSQAVKALSDLNAASRDRQHHVMLDSFLSSSLIINIIRDWIKLSWVARDLEKTISKTESEGLALWPLFSEDWRQSTYGRVSMSNVWHFNLFEKAIQLLPKQNAGVYLQENIDWEFAFLWSWKRFGHKTSIGFPHSTIRFWDLRYFFDPRSYIRKKISSIPLPDVVAINGPLAEEKYLEGGYPREMLIPVEALRYNYLEAQLNNRSDLIVKSPEEPPKLLVLGDYEKTTTNAQLSLLDTAMELIPENLQIIVKPHPLCQILVKDYPKLKMVISNESVERLLLTATVAYTGAITSASVDAYLFGIPVVSILDQGKLNLNPLRGKNDIYFVSSHVELAKALILALTSPKDEIRKQDIFYLDSTLPRWGKVLSTNW